MRIYQLKKMLLQERANSLKNAVLFFYLVGLLGTYRLWISTRTFPPLKTFQWLPDLPYPLDYMWLALNIGLIFAAIFYKKSSKILFFFCCSILVCINWDHNRLSSWFLQYTGICLALCFSQSPWQQSTAAASSSSPSTPHSLDKNKLALDICRLIVIAVYFWGGIQKMNLKFVQSVFPWFISPMSEIISLPPQDVLMAMGILTTIIEAMIGLILFVPKFRNFGVTIIAIFHIFILIFLGPWGHNYDMGVWPWNFAMFVFSYILFYDYKEKINFKLSLQWPIIKSWNFKNMALALTFLVYGILPIATFFGKWDSYLGFCMFSGSTRRVSFLVKDTVHAKLPPLLQKHMTKYNDFYILNSFMFALEDTMYTPIPELRNFRNVKNYLCTYGLHTKDIIMAAETMPDRLTAKTEKLIEYCSKDQIQRNISSLP